MPCGVCAARRALRPSRSLTLALGIGANTAIFSVVHAMLLRAAAVPRSVAARVRLVRPVVGRISAGAALRAGAPGPARSHLASSRSSAPSGRRPAALTGDGDPEQLRVGLVTTNFFSMLGAAAPHRADVLHGRRVAGRAARRPASAGPLWQRRFAGDPGIVGRQIQVNGQPVTVVGVMPDRFRLLMPPDANVPDDLQAFAPLNPECAHARARGARSTSAWSGA